MSLQPFLPLLLAGLLALPPVLAIGSDRVHRVLRRLGVVAFGDHVGRAGRRAATRQRLLQSAHVPTTYRTYAATTLLYAAIGAVVGGVLGMYAIWGVLRLLAIDRAAMRQLLPTALEYLARFAGLGTLTSLQLFAIVLASALTVGLFSGLFTYWFRWWWPEHVAATRRRTVEATMPQAIAFMYALSRSGMAFPKILRIVNEHRRIYGTAASEVGVAVRHMDVFGRDMITALQQVARRTASDQFEEFTENLASVLQSGRSLAAFLEAQYDDFQEEAEAQQERILELLGTLAEGYVTLFVAGPLFFITIMVIIGIAGADTLTLLQVFVYFVLPLGNLGFVLYLDAVTERFGGDARVGELPSVRAHLSDVRRRSSADAGEAADDVGSDGAAAASDGGAVASDGGVAVPGDGRDHRSSGQALDGTAGAVGHDDVARRRANLERLAVHERVAWLRQRLGSPVRTVVGRPVALLYVTVPLALVWIAVRLAGAGGPTIHVLDDVLVQATLFVIGTFALAYEVHRRRVSAIEAAVPDFLDRLASVNEAGLSAVDSIERVRGSELGALGPEVDRIWADVQWGASLETALVRFDRRVRTRVVSRMVALITNALQATGDVSRVLRIAANQAKADRRLRQRRRQQMLSYVVVVYVSFFVFLVIVGALDAVLIPNLPDPSVTPDPSAGSGAAQGAGSGGVEQAVPGGVGALEGIEQIDTEGFELVFLHTALLQGLLSGFVAGQMSSGDLRNGAKHAAILLTIAYVAMLLI